MDDGDYSQRLAAYERSNRRLRIGVLLAGSLAAISLLMQLRSSSVALPDTLEVRELVVRDRADVVRIRIGAELPDAIIDGRVLPRAQEVAGVLLYDETGAERSGYVTSENGDVGLTLDTKTEQVALLGAAADGGAWARFWNADNTDWVEMRVNELGARLNAGKEGAVVFQAPPMLPNESEAFCTDFRDEVDRLTPRPAVRDLLAACVRWASEEQCRLCLG